MEATSRYFAGYFAGGVAANDRMVYVLGKLVAHCSADFIIALAIKTIGSRKPVVCNAGVHQLNPWQP
jgi:hypothetical protein